MKNVINCLKIAGLVLVVTGCRSDTLPDPNDPTDRQQISGEILLRNVGEVMQLLDQRFEQGEITRGERQQILEREVKKMLEKVDLKKVPAKQAWQYGDAYRVAGDWKTARDLYAKAVNSATSVDRRVNDTLRLARAEAHLGNVDVGLKLSRSTFDVGPKDKAPILLAVLYEIVPEALGKGKDKELALLLQDAIAQHKATLVNPTDDGGKAFLMARPAHIHNAWIRIARIYQGLGMDNEAREAIVRDDEDRQKSGTF